MTAQRMAPPRPVRPTRNHGLITDGPTVNTEDDSPSMIAVRTDDGHIRAVTLVRTSWAAADDEVPWTYASREQALELMDLGPVYYIGRNDQYPFDWQEWQREIESGGDDPQEDEHDEHLISLSRDAGLHPKEDLTFGTRAELAAHARDRGIECAYLMERVRPHRVPPDGTDFAWRYIRTMPEHNVPLPLNTDVAELVNQLDNILYEAEEYDAHEQDRWPERSAWNWITGLQVMAQRHEKYILLGFEHGAQAICTCPKDRTMRVHLPEYGMTQFPLTRTETRYLGYVLDRYLEDMDRAKAETDRKRRQDARTKADTYWTNVNRSQQLKSYRNARNISQRTLAETAGVSLGRVRQAEHPTQTADEDTYRKLAAALKIAGRNRIPDQGGTRNKQKQRPFFRTGS